MTHEIFFAGVGGTALGALIGAYISAKLTYEFQQKLLNQQLDFLSKQADADTALRKEIHTETIDTIQKLRDTLNTRIGKIGAQLMPLSGKDLDV